MPDFTVIEGGGAGKHGETIEEYRTRQAFATFAIELLRALGRDADNGARTTKALFDFLDRAHEASVPLEPLIAVEIADLHQRAFGREDELKPESRRKAVLEAALRTTVEYLADDGLAKARRSKQEDRLTAAIEVMLLAREQWSRENGGWSYLNGLSDQLGKWSPPKKVRKPPKS